MHLENFNSPTKMAINYSPDPDLTTNCCLQSKQSDWSKNFKKWKQRNLNSLSDQVNR